MAATGAGCAEISSGTECVHFPWVNPYFMHWQDSGHNFPANIRNLEENGRAVRHQQFANTTLTREALRKMSFFNTTFSFEWGSQGLTNHNFMSRTYFKTISPPPLEDLPFSAPSGRYSLEQDFFKDVRIGLIFSFRPKGRAHFSLQWSRLDDLRHI